MTEPDHIVIAGGGRVGRRVARHFSTRGRDVTIIERDPDATDAVDDGIEVVTGDATRPNVLRSALTDATTTIGALTDRGDTNLAICMAARHFDPDLYTVARIDSENEDEYTEYVDNVMFPERASVKIAVNALSGSDVRTLEEVTGRLELLDIRVDYDAPVAGKHLSELDLPEGCLIVSRSDGDLTARSDTKLVAGRRYIVASDPADVDDVIALFQNE